MVLDIIKALEDKLEAKYGSTANIFTDKELITAEKDYFLIDVQEVSQSPALGARFLRAHQFNITYHPLERGNRLNLYQIASELFDVLGEVTVTGGDLLKGSQMKYTLIEDEMHFDIHYDLYMRKVIDPVDPIESLEHQTSVKG